VQLQQVKQPHSTRKISKQAKRMQKGERRPKTKPNHREPDGQVLGMLWYGMAMGSGLLLVLDLLLLFLYYCALFFFYPRPRLFSRFVQTFFFRRFGFEKRVSNFNSRYTGTQCRCALRYLEGTPVLYGILVSATEV